MPWSRRKSKRGACTVENTHYSYDPEQVCRYFLDVLDAPDVDQLDRIAARRLLHRLNRLGALSPEASAIANKLGEDHHER